MKSELTELLSGFEKRMRVINIAKFLFDYTYKDSIKAMIPNRDVLDNIIIMVLVFIKDRTLGNDQSCRMEDVEDFLSDISGILPNAYAIDAQALAQFIVVDVLQKGGVLQNYKSYSSVKEAFEQMPVRLIEEENGTYHLTDDAFDFLFRSKEIESELDYSVTRFRMAEYIRRDNYKEALDQSRELISKIRSMRTSMDDFVRCCRENFSKIQSGQYEELVTRVRNLLEQEDSELRDIEVNAHKRFDELSQAKETGIDLDDIRNHRVALEEIIANINKAINEQCGLLIKKLSLPDIYRDLLRDSYAICRYERLNFERDILHTLQSRNLDMSAMVDYFLCPLSSPSLNPEFSVESLYSLRSLDIVSEIDDSDEFGDEIQTIDYLDLRDKRFGAICLAFFEFMRGKTEFKISEFVASLSDAQLGEFCSENTLPQVILSLYALQRISIIDWKNSGERIVKSSGEFNLPWCLSDLPDYCLDMDEIELGLLNRSFSFSTEHDGEAVNINMSDFVVKVTRTDSATPPTV